MQDIQSHLHIARRFEFCCERQGAVSLEKRQGEQQSRNELGTDIPGDHIVTGFKLAVYRADLLESVCVLGVAHAEPASVSFHFFLQR